jgi:hypothetical protein
LKGTDAKTTSKVRTLSLRDAPKDFKVALLKELGYATNGSRVLTADGEPYLDPFSGVPVSIDHLAILPGRSPPVVLDDSPFSLSCYLDEYGEIL